MHEFILIASVNYPWIFIKKKGEEKVLKKEFLKYLKLRKSTGHSTCCYSFNANKKSNDLLTKKGQLNSRAGF